MLTFYRCILIIRRIDLIKNITSKHIIYLLSHITYSHTLEGPYFDPSIQHLTKHLDIPYVPKN